MPLCGTSSQRVPWSSQVASASGLKLAPSDGEANSGVPWFAPPSDEASSTRMRPSRVAAATSWRVPTVKTTGVVTKSAFGAVNQSVGCSVFASSATIALA